MGITRGITSGITRKTSRGVAESGFVNADPIQIIKNLVFSQGQPGAYWLPSSDEMIAANTVGSGSASFLDISGRGNNAAQATGGNQPIFGREPKTGRRNLFIRSSEFDNATWTKTKTTIDANATTAPDGLTTADTLIENTEAGNHTLNSANLTFTLGETYTYSIYAKQAGRSRIRMEGGDGNRFPGNAIFDLSAGTVVSATTGTADIVDAGDGWYRCIYTTTSNQTGAAGAFLSLVSAGTTINYTGNGISGVHLWGAQMQTGVVTPLQQVGSIYDVTEEGQTTCYYLLSDGSDDGMATGNVDFTSTNKVTVWVAIAKLSDAAAGRVVELSSSYGNAGAFAIGAPASASATLEFAANGNPSSGSAAYAPSSLAAPLTRILTCTFDLSGGNLAAQIIPWINGVLNQTNGSGVASGGNFRNSPLYLFRRNAATQPFNGKCYGIVIGGGDYSAATKRRVEKLLSTWVPGVTLPQPLLQTQSATSGGTWGPRDGAKLMFLGDDAYQIGGWFGADCDTDWSNDTNIVSNQVYKSSDLGVTWSLIRNQDTTPDATHFSPRHWFSALVADGAMWMLNGDISTFGLNSDVRRSTDGITWTKVNSVAPGYDGNCFSIPGYLNGVFYVAGGQTGVYATDAISTVWRSLDNGVTWESLGDAPWAARGVVDQLVNFNGKLWLISGGKHDPDEGERVYYNDVWSFDGTTWTQELEQGHKQWAGRLWANSFAFDGWLYTSRGWSGVNNSKTYRSRDGREWEEVNWALTASHADAVGVHSAGVMFASGTWALNGSPSNAVSPTYFAARV